MHYFISFEALSLTLTLDSYIVFLERLTSKTIKSSINILRSDII
jgi:hypothetical protein